MRNNFLTQLAATAIVLIAAFPFANTAQAINIGEVVSQSKIGEPLRTQIELTGSSFENVEDACLSLVAPDPNEDGARDFLVAAKLAIKTEGGRLFAVISSHKPYNDPFIRIKLRINCRGVGNIVKSFTILPDFAEVLPIAAPVVAAEAGGMVAANSSGAGKNGMSTSLSVDQNTLQERRQERPRRSKQRAHAAVNDASNASGQSAPMAGASPAQAARRNQGKAGSVRLRLSGAAIDESRIGKISQEERSLLLARQKLLDADDQMANFLALQNQVKQLQAELGMVKLKLAQLGAGSPAVAPAAQVAPDPALAPVAPAPVQAIPAQEATPQQPPQTEPQPAEAKPSEAKPDTAQGQQAQPQPPAKQRKPKIQRGPIIIGLLALLALLLGVRYIMRVRAQSAVAKPVLKRTVVAPAPSPASAPAPSVAPAAKASMQTKISQPGPKPVGKAAAPKPAAAFKARPDAPPKTQIAPPAAPKTVEHAPAASAATNERTQEELAETDSIIEEAELYAIHGHPDRAVLILKELLQQHATKTEAWMLLFSIYSSLKKVAEFESASRDFIRDNKDSSVWPEIQALGRSIDPPNILYADFSAVGTAAAVATPQPTLGKRALLGDILLAMGVLSIQDMEKCLAAFDPKVDGRFGGFLIKRNMITEAQLDAALLQQQLNNEANTFQPEEPAPPLPPSPPSPPKAEEAAPEPDKGMLPALEFEPSTLNLPKMNKPQESVPPPRGFKEGDN